MKTPNLPPYSIVSIAEQYAREKARISKSVTLDDILEDVCYVFGQSVKDVKSKVRKRELVKCRQIYSYISWKKTNFSWVVIAKSMGYQDHTTAIHGKDVVKGFLEVKDENFLSDWRRYLENSKLFSESDF